MFIFMIIGKFWITICNTLDESLFAGRGGAAAASDPCVMAGGGVRLSTKLLFC